MLIHVMDELELCTRAVQVLSRTVGGKVVVTFQVIGQKAYATLQCHQFCPHGSVSISNGVRASPVSSSWYIQPS